LTLVENVTLPMDLCNAFPLHERRARALHLLELVDIVDHADKLPSEISGGQQQRAAIARAMANDPPIIAADEPTGNLDSRTANSIVALFEVLVDQGKTFLMVTHDDDLASRASRNKRGQRRVVTILFCDVTGSIAIANQLAPKNGLRSWTMPSTF
jgi:putative ABC transport system ATP-binding protein